MSFIAEAWAWSQKGLTPIEKLVLLCLSQHHNWERQVAFPSLRTIAKECEVSTSSVQRSLDALEQRNLIKKLPQWRADGSRGSNLYELLLPEQAPTPHEQGGVSPVNRGVSPVNNASEQGIEPGIKNQDLTPNTLRRVLPPKGGFPPPEFFSEFHKILSDGIPGYKPTPSFWATVERYETLDVVDEAHRIVVWFADHPNKRKGANSFILNWLKRSSQDLVRQANDHRSANREQPALPKWEGGVNPFAAYG